jgi:hypothetical protein
MKNLVELKSKVMKQHVDKAVSRLSLNLMKRSLMKEAVDEAEI